ncbi:hypothetical protein AB0K43_16485 [Kitasatospora sp. NPDC049258]|uniref:hypothetical protein n=1 Tax=Kitasatospora sp. NPDC049258 TaxID=3155394 RepID=UPI003422AE54
MSDQPESALFEEELVQALRRVGDEFRTGPAEHERLAGGGAVYGRRLRRRRAAAVAGAAAALALIVTGTFALGLPGGRGARTVEVPAGAAPSGPAPSRPASAGVPPATPVGSPFVTTVPKPVGAQEMVALLTKLLPAGWKVVSSDATGTTPADPKPPGGPSVTLAVDDGAGVGTVMVAVGRLATPVDLDQERLRCPNKADEPDTDCSREPAPGGSFLTIEQNRPRAGTSDSRKRCSATLVTPAGTQVTVVEWNAGSRTDGRVTRKDPPLTVDRLRSIATSAVWDKVAAALPEPGPSGSGPDRLTVEQMLAIAVPLLPVGATVTEPAGAPGRASFLLNAGRGPGLVEITLRDGSLPPTGKEVADGFADVEQLPDGTRVRSYREDAPTGGKGVIRDVAEVLGTDRLWVTVRAYNGPSPALAARPVLTPDQLMALATAASWHTDRAS